MIAYPPSGRRCGSASATPPRAVTLGTQFLSTWQQPAGPMPRCPCSGIGDNQTLVLLRGYDARALRAGDADFPAMATLISTDVARPWTTFSPLFSR